MSMPANAPNAPSIPPHSPVKMGAWSMRLPRKPPASAPKDKKVMMSARGLNPFWLLSMILVYRPMVISQGPDFPGNLQHDERLVEDGCVQLGDGLQLVGVAGAGLERVDDALLGSRVA